MNKRAFWVWACLGLLASPLWAQKLEFEKNSHDFGSFKEEAGPQRIKFTFVNKGDKPLLVSNVSASCGCTTPGWSKEAVAPGQKGFVEAEYNPAGRPGKFEKQLTVISNDVAVPSTILTIKGEVKEKEKTIADIYPRKAGEFRLQSEYLNLGRIVPSKGETTQTFKIYNEHTGPLTIEPFTIPQGHLKVSVSPTTIAPNQTGEIKVVYDARKKNDWGYSSDAIVIPYKGGVSTKMSLYVVGTLEEEPKVLSPEEAAKAPKLEFKGGAPGNQTGKEHSFGELAPGEIVSHEFVFTNKGKAPLEIYKTKASCGCTASDPAKKKLNPGESSSIKVTFNSTGKHNGPQSQTVTIYTNDPAEPTQYITIKADINDKKQVPSLAKPAMGAPAAK